jgi:hypothetical protein
VFIDLREGTARVAEAHDLKSLSVRAPGGVADASALGALGTPDGGHVWLSVVALREAAAATVPTEERSAWVQGFDGMIAFAVSKGWTDESGERVRAHVEAVS